MNFAVITGKHSIKKIVVIGPESTGKSTLCEQLAEHYKTTWCPEYAREYLLTHGTRYGYEDLLIIARGQIISENKYLKAFANNLPDKEKAQPASPAGRHPTLFIDTDMYVMKVWCEYVYGKCHPYILEQIQKRKYDLYLLCNVDLPWVKDELREYPDLETREKLFQIYKNIMQEQAVPWAVISGNYEERLQKAIEASDKIVLPQRPRDPK